MYTREQILDAIENCLDESERKIIKARFGVEDGLTTTLDEIVLNITKTLKRGWGCEK